MTAKDGKIFWGGKGKIMGTNFGSFNQTSPRQEKRPLMAYIYKKKVLITSSSYFFFFFFFFFQFLHLYKLDMILIRRSQTLILTAAISLILLTFLSWNDSNYVSYLSPATRLKQEEAIRAIDQRYCGGPCKFLLPVFIVEQGKIPTQ